MTPHPDSIEYFMGDSPRKNARRKQGKFNPRQSYIDKAKEEYFARGGTIKKIEIDEEMYNRFMSMNFFEGEQL